MAVAAAVAVVVAVAAVAHAALPLRVEEVGIQGDRPVQGEGADLHDLGEVHLAVAARDDPHRRVQRPYPRAGRVPPPGVDEVALVQEAHVAEADLLPEEAGDAAAARGAAPGAGAAQLEGLEAGGVADADDAVEAVGGLHEGVGEEGLRDGGHLGEPGALDDQPVPGRPPKSGLPRGPGRQPPEGVDEVPADPAAQAAVGHDGDARLAPLHRGHELVVDGDAAELVLDDRDALAVLALEDEVQEGRLPRPEEAREDRRFHAALLDALAALDLALLGRRNSI
mmetsp:Transcript_37464/g.105818  ORF Transcript_37464/g.105818 Transcript_37464/m.105818 type:complete len:281 (-) Transcript_37464:159-1001(-)